MARLLLDTHTFYWLVSGEVALADQALLAIDRSQNSAGLYISPITGWELSVAAQKPRMSQRPKIDPADIRLWLREALRVTGAKVIPIRQKIALEAADVVFSTGHRDPGDCYLIATARVGRMPIATRDRAILDIAQLNPEYLSVVAC